MMGECEEERRMGRVVRRDDGDCPWTLRADSGWEVFSPLSGDVVFRCHWQWLARLVSWVSCLDYDVMR